MIRQDIEEKSIIWFSNTNQYSILEPITADCLELLAQGISLKEIASQLKNSIQVSEEEALGFITQINTDLFEPNCNTPADEQPLIQPKSIPNFETTKYYKINDFIFKVAYQSQFEVYLIHPKFSHLEIEPVQSTNKSFQVFTENDITFLRIDDELIGAWPRKDIHYFQGKFSMFIVQFTHNKPEEEWMGIFHASGLGNDSKSLLLLGDSGNGKSTSLAILQANGLTCLADDFVPMDSQKQHVYTFPSAISIKRNSLETLLPLYPELENTAEFHFKRLNKIVRYLPPKTKDSNFNLPCNDLVFIKYEKGSDLQFSAISKIEAFQQLIPDSWISEKPENVSEFLQWFAASNCYRLTYSDNDKMVKTIKKLLSNEL